jgi:hypothetical protein
MLRNRNLGLAIIALVSLVGLQTSGCSNSSSNSNDIAFSCVSDPQPPRVGINSFRVTLATSGGERVAGARISLEGGMSHSGMGPVFGEAKEVAPGRYQGTLELNMRGDWIVMFHVTLAGGRTFDRQVEIQNIQAA